MNYCRFAVIETAYCVWGPNIIEQNIKFVEGIEPKFFSHVVDKHFPLPEDKEEEHYSALALRMNYCQALEVFFALVGAYIQAPDCIGGWLHRYRPNELRELIHKLKYGYRGILNKFKLDVLSLDTISQHVSAHLPIELKNRDTYIGEFSKLWSRFAYEYLEDELIDEYNSIKHGLRVTPGGFFMAIGVQESRDKPAPPEKMVGLGGSKYGSTYFIPTPIGENERIRPHFQLKENTVNWDPEAVAGKTVLLSICIHNLLSRIKIVNGVDIKKVTFGWPKTLELFNEPWEIVIGTRGGGFNPNISEKDIVRFTDEEILEIYKQ